MSFEEVKNYKNIIKLYLGGVLGSGQISFLLDGNDSTHHAQSKSAILGFQGEKRDCAMQISTSEHQAGRAGSILLSNVMSVALMYICARKQI